MTVSLRGHDNSNYE